MRLISLILILSLLCAGSVAADVEVLIQAREYWQDGKSTLDWTIKDFKDFWRQTHKGEIIGVFEGGKQLGRLDVPPTFVQVTIKGVTLEQAKKYLNPMTEQVGDSTVIVKQRRHYFKRMLVDSALALWEVDSSRITITKAQALLLIKEYDLAVVKQKIIDRLQR